MSMQNKTNKEETKKRRVREVTLIKGRRRRLNNWKEPRPQRLHEFASILEKKRPITSMYASMCNPLKGAFSRHHS